MISVVVLPLLLMVTNIIPGCECRKPHESRSLWVSMDEDLASRKAGSRRLGQGDGNSRDFGSSGYAHTNHRGNLMAARNRWQSVVCSVSSPALRWSQERLQDNKLMNRVVLIFCCFLYGSSYVSTKYMQNRIDAVMVTTLRFFVGFISFLPILLRFDAKKEVIFGGIEVGLWYALGFVTQGIALQTSSASKASFICALGVVVAPLLDLFFPSPSSDVEANDEDRVYPQRRVVTQEYSSSMIKRIGLKLVRWPFLPSTLACVGAAILEFGSILDPPSISDVLLFVPPIAYSIAVWRCEKISRRMGDDHQPNQLSAYMTLTSFVASGFYAILQGVFPRKGAEWKSLWNAVFTREILFFLFYEGCLATAAVSSIEQHILKRLSAAEVTLIYSMEPLFATLTSIGAGVETLTREVLLGGAFILFGCYIDCM